MYRSEDATVCYVRDSLRQCASGLERALDEAWDGFCALAGCDEDHLREIPSQRHYIFH